MDILSKLYTWSPQQAIEDIISHRHSQHHCVVHFLYFANVVRHDILSTKAQRQKTKKASSQQLAASSYYNALLTSDFLLPDGIALQTFYAAAVSLDRVSSDRKRLANCNGTDLTLPLLQQLPKDAQIHLYGAGPSVIQKAADFLRTQDITPVSITDGYNDFDRSKMDSEHKNILLIGRWSPLQELRVTQNMEQIKKYKVLVMSVGWLFDFWWGEEKRTPKFFRGRAEWLRRFFAHPRKNARKVRYSLSLPYMIIRYLLLKTTKS